MLNSNNLVLFILHFFFHLTFPLSVFLYLEAVGYPFDLIKTRIQATTREKHAKGMYVTAIELIQESNGKVISGLYRGFGLKLARAVPASMIGFLTYETVAGTIRGS